MEMRERIKMIRTHKSVDMTQAEFSVALGLAPTSAASWEKKANPQVPTESMRILICEKFNVNRHWLETGEGEMFLPKPESSLPAELSNDPMIRAILEAYLDLDAQGRQTFQRFFSDVVARYKGDSPAHQPSPAEQARARGGIPLDDFNNSSQSKSS